MLPKNEGPSCDFETQPAPNRLRTPSYLQTRYLFVLGAKQSFTTILHLVKATKFDYLHYLNVDYRFFRARLLG